MKIGNSNVNNNNNANPKINEAYFCEYNKKKSNIP